MVPAGARISAGISGKVLTSLPSMAEVLVNWSPVNCIPSPESPEKTITTDWRSSCRGSCLSAGTDEATVSAIALDPPIIGMRSPVHSACSGTFFSVGNALGIGGQIVDVVRELVREETDNLVLG